MDKILATPIISVIVPVYNAEKYLRPCLDSILEQTYAHLKIILIDDGSKDLSGKICDEYAQHSDNITVIHQPNGGATAARSKGVEAADKNGFITFVDADDTLPPKSLEILYEAASESDIVLGRIKASWIKRNNRYSPGLYSPEEYRLGCVGGKGLVVAPYAHLFRASLFDEHTLDIPRSVVRGEDLIMNVRLAFANICPVKIIDDEVYEYRDNVDSITHKFIDSLSHEEAFLTALLSSHNLLDDSACVKQIVSFQLYTLYRIALDSSRRDMKSAVLLLLESRKAYLTNLQRMILCSRSRRMIKLGMFIHRAFAKIKHI